MDRIYTLIFPPYFQDPFGKYDRVPRVIHAMIGCDGEEVLQAARRRRGCWGTNNER